MRQTGTLRSWHDDKGFGFIAPTQGGRGIFVHISAMPRDGSRPTVGEALSYEIGQGQNGKPQAVKVIRTAIGARQPPSKSPAPLHARRNGRLGSSIAALVILLVLGTYGFKQYQSYANRMALETAPPLEITTTPAPSPERETPTPSTFRCDGRTHCSQMTSCQEAKWFLSHCPGTQMDGDNDGVPCEQQFCNGLFSN